MEPKTEQVEIQTTDGPMSAYLALPSKTAAAPRSAARAIRAVVVVQEAFGVNHHIQEVCKRVAAEGYLAIAPEFFHRMGRGLDLPYGDFSKVMPIFKNLTNEHIRTDIAAALAWLEKRFEIPSRQTAVMGFCMGGLAAMISACAHEIGTAVSYYGGGMVEGRPGIGFSPVIQDFDKISCPVLLVFGGEDQSIPPEHVRKIEEELKAKRKAHEILVYPGAGHGFTNDERPSFHAASSAAAWKETLAWLART